MYLVNDLNRMGLFKKTSQFILEDNCKDILNQIFYRASACALSFRKISQFQSLCGQEFEKFDDQVTIKDNKVHFISANSISILNEVTPLLSSLRILQNLFIILVGKYYKCSLPSSMNDFQKKIEKYTDIPKEIIDLVKNHWEQSGLFLKQLRDLDQHFYFLNENSYMTFSPKKEIVIIFPDNPEIKSSKELLFKNRINGLSFLEKSFNEIHGMYEAFAEFLSYKDKNILFQIGFQHIRKSSSKKDRTLLMFYQEDYQKLPESKTLISISCLIANETKEGKITVKNAQMSQEKYLEATKKGNST